jgi:predicted Holliday junction resolvase-like endonuclease
VTAALWIIAFGLLLIVIYLLFKRHKYAPSLEDAQGETQLRVMYEERAREAEKAIEKMIDEHATELQRLRDEHDADNHELEEAYANAAVEFRHQLELQFERQKREDRKQSNARSRTSLVAKISEHMAPYFPGFPYNPKEVRHFGEVFDFIVYDGIEEGRIRNIVFLEVKTSGRGRVTNPREKLLREAIKAGRIKYEVFVPQMEVIEGDVAT